MANDVTRPSHSEISERDPYAAYADEVNTRPFVGELLRFSKHGQYKAGQEQEVVEAGTRMFVFMPGLKRGWVKWGDGQPLAHIMGLVSDAFQPPERSELGDDNEDEWETLNDRPIDPWQPTNHLPMCDTKGTIYTFVSSSKGGLSEIGRLSELYANRRRMKPDEIPVIELQSRSYDHKLYGETLAPVFKVIGWVTPPQTFTELNAPVEDYSDETLALEDLMEPGNDAVGHEDEYEDEVDTTPEPPRRAPQKPVQRAPVKPPVKTAPQKPAPKPLSKTSPSRGGKAAPNGRRSPRI